MKIVLKEREVIATHDDNQEITLDLYPTADRIIQGDDLLEAVTATTEEGDTTSSLTTFKLKDSVNIEAFDITKNIVKLTLPYAKIRKTSGEGIPQAIALVEDLLLLNLGNLKVVNDNAEITLYKSFYESLSTERKEEISSLVDQAGGQIITL